MDETANERFERLAKAFYRDTGLIAPGKTAPMDFPHTDPELRRSVWDVWIEQRHHGEPVAIPLDVILDLAELLDQHGYTPSAEKLKSLLPG